MLEFRPIRTLYVDVAYHMNCEIFIIPLTLFDQKQKEKKNQKTKKNSRQRVLGSWRTARSIGGDGGVERRARALGKEQLGSMGGEERGRA